MDCCCQKNNNDETFSLNPFHSLHQTEHPTVSTLAKDEEEASMPIPKLSVSLDLPGYTDYLPTYWPGQKITGKISIELLSPIKVSSLRIVLFGQVQVHGDQPRQPLTNGMFDYLKNVQIINKGLQVTRRPQTSSSRSTPSYRVEENQDEIDVNNNTEIASPDPCWRIYCRRSSNNNNHYDDNGTSNSSIDTSDNNNNSSNNNNSNNNDNNYIRKSGESKKRLKTAEDRQIERLIKEIATFCDSTGIRIDLPHHRQPPSKTEFELNANHHHIRFSMDAPDKLPSSFDHPNFPISYSIVTLMTCRASDDTCFTLYATAKLRLERFLDLDLSQHTGIIQTPFAYRHIPNNNSRISNLLSSSFHFIKTSLPLNNLKPMGRITTTLEQNKHLSSLDSFLNVYLELPKQAFEPSQQVPLQLKLLNNTTSFRICTIKTEIRLVRRINMTCNLGEEVEGTVLNSVQLVLQNTAQQNLDFSKLAFDLSNVLMIPEDAANTISNEATKDVFSMTYNYHATVYVTGEKTEHVNLNSQETTFYIQQRDLQRLSCLKKMNCCSENHVHKTYLFEIDPLVVTVGRFPNGTI